MSLFNFSQEELLSFFAVLTRFSVLVAVLPFLGDRLIPAPIKVLLSLAMTLVLFPALVARGHIRPTDAAVWGSTAGGIIGTMTLEIAFALILGFTAKMTFDTITFGGNLVGTFMGFAAASTYDPHQESQTQVVAEVQLALAMLLFLVLDGHHLMLRAALDSYRIVGVGQLKPTLGPGLSQSLISFSGQVVESGIALAAPIAIVIFAVNIAFGVLAKAMPQLNIFMLSFAASAMIGLIVMFLSIPEFGAVANNVMARMGQTMESVMKSMAKGS